MSDRDQLSAVAPAPSPPPHAGFVGFPAGRAPLPSPLYIGRDDRLLVRVHNTATGLAVVVRVRLMQPDGLIVPLSYTLRPTADRTLQTASFDLTEGFLLGLAVLGESAVARRGQAFVAVLLVRGGALASEPVQTLVADYLSEGQLVGWPGGEIRSSVEGPGVMRSIAGTNPAAGAEASEAVPTDARWRLSTLRVQLVTSAAVAARRVHLLVDDGATVLLDLAAADTQAASLTRNYNVAADGFARAAQTNEIYLPIPPGLVLPQAYRIRTSTENLQAGDDFGAPQLAVEEWLED